MFLTKKQMVKKLLLEILELVEMAAITWFFTWVMMLLVVVVS